MKYLRTPGFHVLRLLLLAVISAYTFLPLVCGVWHDMIPEHNHLLASQAAVAVFPGAQHHAAARDNRAICLSCQPLVPGATLVHPSTPASVFQALGFFASVSIRFDIPRPESLSVSVPAVALLYAVIALPLVDPPPRLAL
jgi:hypothetical protein